MPNPPKAPLLRSISNRIPVLSQKAKRRKKERLREGKNRIAKLAIKIPKKLKVRAKKRVTECSLQRIARYQQKKLAKFARSRVSQYQRNALALW